MTIERSGGTARGTIHYQGVDYPFQAQVRDVPGGFDLGGALLDDGEQLPFSAMVRGDRIVVAADGQRAELRVVAAESPRTEPEPKPSKKKAPSSAAKRPSQVKLRKVEFRDIHMGNQVAYTQLVPKDWEATGKVLWSGGNLPHPQRDFTITAPNGIMIRYLPAMVFEFIELDPQTAAQMRQYGQPIPMPSPNVAPPADIAAWMASFLEQTGTDITGARVIETKRDHEVERYTAQMLGGDTGTTQHRMSIGYRHAGRDYRAEIALAYQVLPMTGLSIGRAATWIVYVGVIAALPVDLYDAYLPLVSSIVASQQTTPEWFAAKTRTLSTLSQQRHANAMATIRANGARQAKATDDQMASWRRQQAASDKSQRRFVNSIHETDDYATPGGGSVNLPSAYNHVYQTDGGDYLLSDAPLNGLRELRPQR